VDVQFARGRTLDIVTQAETIATYGDDIAGDYACYTAGTAMLETAERLVAEEMEPAVQQYLLLVAALRALAAGERAPVLALDSYLLRSLALAGYAPTFSDCARCGAAGPHRSFSAGAGGMLCGSCRLPGSATPAPETVELLGALLSGDWTVAETIDVRYRKPASGIVAAYLQWHLERGIRSLAHVER
jgi:DNA repair protein RecO (recombination protein O)